MRDNRDRGRFQVTFRLQAPSLAHAVIVAAERTEYDEAYDGPDGEPFDYQITTVDVIEIEQEETLSPAAERLAEILGDYPPFGQEEAPTPTSLDDDPDRICLIEKNARDGANWITLWPTADRAVEYHFSTDGDYDMIDIIDLETGERYEATHTARKVKP